MDEPISASPFAIGDEDAATMTTEPTATANAFAQTTAVTQGPSIIFVATCPARHPSAG